MSFRRILPFILLNIVVSATVVLVILWWWDGRSGQNSLVLEAQPQVETAVVDQPDETAVAEAANVALQETEAESVPVEQELGLAVTEKLHVVQAGDTLGILSLQYGVTIDEIMQANEMANPNVLFVGQQLIIPNQAGIPTPLPGLRQETAVDNGAPPTPIPTVPAGSGSAVVGITTVTAVGLLGESLEIVNSGSSEINLAGWKVADQFGNVYTFDSITLFGEGAGIQLHTTAGTDSPTDLYWGLEGPIWQSGSEVQIYDAEGNVQTEFTVP